MGSNKEHMLDRGYQVMIQWMHVYYDIPEEEEIDENYPDFESMATSYNEMMEYQDEQLELKWFEDHPYHEIYSAFGGRMRQLQNMLAAETNPFTDKMIHYMVYSHAVTLFEAMVGDIIKACVRKFPEMMDKLVLGVAEITKEKYSLKDIIKHKGVEGIALTMLNDLTFHNIGVVNQYANMLSGNKFESQYESQMIQITHIRHDFIHRNGANKKGEYHDVSSKMVSDAIEVIRLYADDVYRAIRYGVVGSGDF
jgi:hypothetical protein